MSSEKGTKGEEGRVFTTPEGYRLEVYSSLYMDWGLTISFHGVEVYTNPHVLSGESYGQKPNPEKFEDWDEAEEASLDGDDEAFVPWDDADWREALKDQSDDLISACLGDDAWDLVHYTDDDQV